MPSDIRAQQAREYHRLAAEDEQRAGEHRARRDRLVRQLRVEDPETWTYAALAKAVGCSPELAAHIVKNGPLERPYLDAGDRSQDGQWRRNATADRETREEGRA